MQTECKHAHDEDKPTILHTNCADYANLERIWMLTIPSGINHR